MNLISLRDTVRRRLRDTTSNPPLWSDEEIDGNINESEREAATRGLLIFDTTSILTQLDVTTADKQYTIDPKIIDVLSIEDSNGSDVSGWTLIESRLIFSSFPTKDETLTLNCYRLPLVDMVDDTDEPEIRSTYHDRMLDWAISLCYLVPDSDGYDPGASERYALRFERSFGERKSAITQRNHRDKTSRTVAYNGAM